MTTWIDAMLTIADTIPGAGRTDLKSLEKMRAEIGELQAAQFSGDILAVLTEIPDVMYCAAKASHVDLMSVGEAQSLVEGLGYHFGLTVSEIVALAQAKYSWRQSHPKDDAKERELVRVAYNAMNYVTI